MTAITMEKKYEEKYCWICHTSLDTEQDELERIQSLYLDTKPKVQTKTQRYCNCNGSMSHVHQQCLSSWLSSKHKDLLNDRCAYPWRKLPPLKCKMCKQAYRYSFTRQLKIRKSDFTLVFLVMAQIIIFALDLFTNMEGTVNSCVSSSNCTNTCDNQITVRLAKDRGTLRSIWDVFSIGKIYYQDGIASVIYISANLLTLITVAILIIAGIYNVYHGLTKTVKVHPIKSISK
ncbi:unnamed protein product [Moneuplotes crassus]|uniref:RING-CH-type domain-containing protein n=1 Tax=Euplotes crassus TaxID=5936 RepID=A0AAD1USA6_EUPCR|nr:unnamed protein product [Moneuplotes crassus]